ncbi:MAG: hypothetical protein RLZZ387_4500 [Chloroflexota bacterium]|jgi:hypothetical protein
MSKPRMTNEKARDRPDTVRRNHAVDAPQSTAEILARIERAMQRVTEAIAPLSPAQLLQMTSTILMV